MLIENRAASKTVPLHDDLGAAPVAVSVVIPALNEERLLPHLLSDLAAQQFRDFEVIVADARSRDRTREIALAAGARVVEGGVPSVGRNAGARVARGGVFIFLDADVRAGPRFVGDAAAEFRRRSLALASCPLDPDCPDHGLGMLFRIYNWLVPHSHWIRTMCSGACLIVGRDLFERIGGFDERLRVTEDEDFVARAARNGKFRMLDTVRLVLSTRRMRAMGTPRFLAYFVLSSVILFFRPTIRSRRLADFGFSDLNRQP